MPDEIIVEGQEDTPAEPTAPDTASSGDWFQQTYPKISGDADAVKHFGRYKSAEDALLAGWSAHKLVGDPKRLPDSIDGMDDIKRAFFVEKVGKLLGAKAKPEEYTLTRPKDANGTYDEKFEQTLRTLGVKHHIPQGALAAIHEAYNGRYLEEAKEMDALWGKFETDRLNSGGENAWNEEKLAIQQFFGEWAPKAGYQHQDVVAGIVEALNTEKALVPFMGTLAHFLKESHGHPVTELGKGSAPKRGFLTYKKMGPGA